MAGGGHPGLPPPPSLRPSATGTLGRRPEDDLAPASPHPLPHPCHKAAPTRRSSASRRGDPRPRRRGQWVMKPPRRITAEGAGGQRGGGGGWELVPELTCSPGEGWGRRGRADPGACVRRGARPRRLRPRPPQPREPPELRRRTGGAQSSSCPRPRRRGDVSVHTYTHSGGRGAQSGAQLSPCFRGPGEKAAGAIEPGPCLGRKLQQDGRDGENSPGFGLRVLFLFFTHFHR